MKLHAHLSDNKINLILLNNNKIIILQFQFERIYVTQYTHNMSNSTNPTYIENHRFK